MTTTDAPERIWAGEDAIFTRRWREDDQNGGTEYIRADLTALSQPQAGEPMEPLGADFEAVWDKNVAGLYESDPASPHPANPAQVTDANLDYGLKLIAEAIDAHFGDRDDAYKYEMGDTTIHDVWEAYDALTVAIGAGRSSEPEFETAPDNGTPAEVLAYVLDCARRWVPEARIIGNARAGDIERAIAAIGTGGQAVAVTWQVRDNPDESDAGSRAFDVLLPSGEWRTCIAVGPSDARDCIRDEWLKERATQSEYLPPVDYPHPAPSGQMVAWRVYDKTDGEWWTTAIESTAKYCVSKGDPVEPLYLATNDKDTAMPPYRPELGAAANNPPPEARKGKSDGR